MYANTKTFFSHLLDFILKICSLKIYNLPDLLYKTSRIMRLQAGKIPSLCPFIYFEVSALHMLIKLRI